MVIGTGVDIVETERIRALIDLNGERFLLRWYDTREIVYCQQKKNPHLHLAACFAAKEAAFKALRLSWAGPLCWKDIVVDHDSGNVPRLSLSREPRAVAERIGVTSLTLSLSHCDAYAIAMVTAERVC